MLCGFAAAGASHRPENSDKATTSLERPSRPTSGRVTRPVSFPEISLRTARPASRLLGRSASAPSVCSHTGSQAETVSRRAARSVESLLECPKALPREGPPPSPPPPLNSSDHAACAAVAAPLAEEPGAAAASPSPRRPPSRNTPDTPVPTSSWEESKAEDDALGREPPVEVAAAGGGSASSGTWRPAEDPGAGFPSPYLEPNQRDERRFSLQTHNESAKDPPLDDQGREPPDREHGCPVQVSPSPAVGALPSLALAAEGGRRPGSAPRTCPRSQTFLEVEVAEETLVVSGHLLDQQQEVGLPAAAAAASLGGSPMEVELSQQDSSWLADSLPGSTATFGVTDTSALASLSTSSSEGQPSSLAEEPCPSLTSALKELHWLLVESCKGLPSREENGRQPAGASAEEAATRGALEEGPECPELERLFPDAGEGEVASTGLRLWEGSGGGQGVHRWVPRSRQEASVMGEPLDWNGPAVQSSLSAASSQLGGGSSSSNPPATFPPPFSSSPGHQALGQSQSLSSGLPQDAEDASRSAGSSSPAPGTLGSAAAAEPSQPPPVGSPAIGPAALRPPVFPAADIDRIAGSGFTPQEAGEALARAGGNADLALLILLAKNIVVPM